MADKTKISWTDATLNAQVGCSRVSEGCRFCLDGSTKVLTEGMAWLPLSEIQPGDKIVAFTESPAHGANRKFELATVLHKWQTRSSAVEISIGGRKIIASEDHKFLSVGRPYWKEAADLHLHSKIVDIGYEQSVNVNNEDYLRGYIAGTFAGDGTYRLDGSGRNGTKQSYGRVAVLTDDMPLLQRLVQGLQTIGCEHIKVMPHHHNLSQNPESRSAVPFTEGKILRPMSKVETRRAGNLELIANTFSPNIDNTLWCAGFLAGFFDTDGSYNQNVRWHQVKMNKHLETTMRCLDKLGFVHKLENFTNTKGKSVRLVGGVLEHIKLFSAIQPALLRKLKCVFGVSFPKQNSTVDGIRRLPGERDLFDIETTSGTFIAEGFATHNCYAEGAVLRVAAALPAYEGLVKNTERGPRWTGVIRLFPEKLMQPLRWTRPRKIFVNSLSDMFHEDVPFKDICAMFAVMAAAKQHIFQILTKRPERALEFFKWLRDTGEANLAVFPNDSEEWRRGQILCAAAVGYGVPRRVLKKDGVSVKDVGVGEMDSAIWPLPNVHIGVSVEHQEAAEERIPLLLQIPSAVRWISMEPQIGAVTLKPWLESPVPLDWVVVGGESGKGARPFHLEWAREIIQECQGAEIPVYIKQLGGNAFLEGVTFLTKQRAGATPEEWPEDLRIQEWPAVP